MIGVKPKKNKDTPVIVQGQATISGKVTERNTIFNNVYDLKGASISLYQNDSLVVRTTSFDGGLYNLTAIDSGDNYKLVFSKDSIYETPPFSLIADEQKVLNVELTTTKIER